MTMVQSLAMVSPHGSMRSLHSMGRNSDMNYSIPRHTPSSGARPIQRGGLDTHTKQLEAQIGELTLQNVKLQRTNRLLKVDTDNLIEQKTQPLERTIHDLTLANVQLQRATRLLQQELDEKSEKLNAFHHDQILQMKTVGPEYEYLVQMVNLLHRQISGDASCKETCCFTALPVNASSVTVPREDDSGEVRTQHVCRPALHSALPPQGTYAVELEHKITRLELLIEDLDGEKSELVQQLNCRDDDETTLKKELRLKDGIVSELEQDFKILEERLEALQKEADHHDVGFSQTVRHAHHDLVHPPHDPKRQSQRLMESKRRSFGIKDTQLLEDMLRSDLGEPGSEIDSEDDTGKDTKMTTPPRATSPTHTFTNAPIPFAHHLFPGAYTSEPRTAAPSELSLSLVFAVMTSLLALAAQLGITDDWTVPITLVALVSGFLWSGGAKGVQVQLKLR